MEMIQFDQDRNLWVLQTENTAYAFGLSAEGALCHTYYGPRLPFLSDYPGARLYPEQSSFDCREGLSPEEYMSWCDSKYTEPCIKATFSDHTRDVVLKYAGFSAEGDSLSVTLRDAAYPLRVELRYRVAADCDLIEKSACVVNEGTEPVRLEQILSGSLFPARSDAYRLTSVSGKWAGEFQLRRAMLPDAKTVLESRRGTTSHGANPFVMLDENGSATETGGRVYVGALAYSGNWKITVEKTSFRMVKVCAGVNDFDFAWLLEPGASFTAPPFLIGYTEKGFGAASRMLHAYQLNHVLPAGHRGELRKVLYNSWEARLFDVNEEEQCRLADAAASLGIELFVMDDGWFGARDNDRAGLGDWFVNRRKFPNGLSKLIRHVNGLGMDFGLWVEPEMVNPDSDLYRRHPGWVYRFENRPGNLRRNQLVLNLAREDVRAYLYESMDRLLTENNIQFIKWDMNRNFSEPGYPEEAPEKQREIWVRHVEGLYGIVERLRAAHPGVLFQSCSGGGGRVDLGVLRRFDQVWASDNTNASDRLPIQEGFSYAYCAKVMESWVTGSSAPGTLPLEFRFHCAMTGNLGIGVDLFQWDDAQREKARALIAEYKQIRPIVQHGRQYRLMGTQGPLTAVSYVGAERDRAVLFAFWQHGRFGDRPLPVRLQGLDETALYEAEGYGRMSGKALMCVGLTPEFAGDPGSVLIRIEKV